MTMRSLLQIFIIASLFLLALKTHAVEENLIDQIEGVYVAPGKATYQECRNCAWVPVKNATDCLVIKKLTNETANIFMSTIQARGHSCTIDEDYVFTVRGKNALFFQDSEMPLEKKSDGIYVIKDGDKIKFSIQPQKIESMYLVCGNAASTENVSFKLSLKRVPWEKNKTINMKSSANLFQYCPAWNKP